MNWIENFFNSFKGFVDYQKAKLLHQQYVISLEKTNCRDSFFNKKKQCVELIHQFLRNNLCDQEINIDVDPCSFIHIKSLVASLSQAFLLIPKCSVLLILHGMVNNQLFQGHNFVISWIFNHVDDTIMTFVDPAGMELSWQIKQNETHINFFIRVMDCISDIVVLYIQSDHYSHEEIRSILLYKGTTLETLIGLDNG